MTKNSKICTNKAYLFILIISFPRPDGSDWKPHNRSRICSDHFIGNKKSEDPRSPSYNPTTFPSIYRKKYTSDNVAFGRYQRFLKRLSKEFEKEDLIKKKKNIEFEKEEDCNH